MSENSNNKNNDDNNDSAQRSTGKNNIEYARFNCRYYRQNAFCGVNQSAFCAAWPARRYLFCSNSSCFFFFRSHFLFCRLRMFAPISSSICMLLFVNSEFVTNKRFFFLNARFLHSFLFVFLFHSVVVDVVHTVIFDSHRICGQPCIPMLHIPSLFFRLTFCSQAIIFFGYTINVSGISISWLSAFFPRPPTFFVSIDLYVCNVICTVNFLVGANGAYAIFFSQR